MRWYEFFAGGGMARLARDRRNSRLLRKDGWALLRVWEHALGDPQAVVRKIRRMTHALV
jgi:G:T-mismatch repair DNA endonuclease (very short patch repair protein)